MGQPVHRASHLYRAGLAGVVTGQVAQVILGGDQPRAAPHDRRGEPDVERPGLAIEVVEDPDVTRAVIDDAPAVGARIAGVEPVVVGVPPQASAVQRARVQVARALVVGQEHQPAPDDHRAGQLTGQVLGHPGEPERFVARRAGAGSPPGHPETARGPAAVALPECGLPAMPTGEQRHGGRLDGQIAHRAERQPLERPVLGPHRVCPGVVRERLTVRGDRQQLAVRGPAGDPGILVAPERHPAGHSPAQIRLVHIRDAVALTGPGDRPAVARQPRVAGPGAVRGQPPGPAAVGRREPHVVVSDEGQQVGVQMRKAQVPVRSHRLMVDATRPLMIIRPMRPPRAPG